MNPGFPGQTVVPFGRIAEWGEKAGIRAPSQSNFVFTFMQFSGKIHGRIIDWHRSTFGFGAPLLWEILDPPLSLPLIFVHTCV